MTANMELSRILAICFISWINFAKIAITGGTLGCNLNRGQCREGNVTHARVVTCANAGPVNLTCPVGHTIYIQSAFWGRENDRHCSQSESYIVSQCRKRIDVNDIPCHSIKSKCSFRLRDNNNSLVYGDDCVKHLNTTMKYRLEKSIYMDINYYCLEPEKFDEASTQTVIMPSLYVSSAITQTDETAHRGINLAACSWSRGNCHYLSFANPLQVVITCSYRFPEVNLTCPSDQVIDIQEAYWGRQDDKHCSLQDTWKVRTCGPRKVQVNCEKTSNCRMPLKIGRRFKYEFPCNVSRDKQELLRKSIYMRVSFKCIQVNRSDATTSGTMSSIDMNASGSAGVGIGIGITAALIVFIIISVLVFLWWRRRPQTKYIKENEAVYVPTHPDDVAPPTPNCNQTNPTYDQQPPETHEYEYVRVDQGTDTNGSGKEDHYSDPQYATVDENEVNNQNGPVTTDKSGLPQSPQYETVYPDDTTFIYDAEYGAVNFTENDLYKR